MKQAPRHIFRHNAKIIFQQCEIPWNPRAQLPILLHHTEFTIHKGSDPYCSAPCKLTRTIPTSGNLPKPPLQFQSSHKYTCTCRVSVQLQISSRAQANNRQGNPMIKASKLGRLPHAATEIALRLQPNHAFCVFVTSPPSAAIAKADHSLPQMCRVCACGSSRVANCFLAVNQSSYLGHGARQHSHRHPHAAPAMSCITADVELHAFALG